MCLHAVVCTLLTALCYRCRRHDAPPPATGRFQWPRLKLEQSAASDKSRQLTTAVSAWGKNTSLRAVILTDQKQLLRLTICRQKLATLCRSLYVPANCCKVPLKHLWCDNVTLILTFLITTTTIIAAEPKRVLIFVYIALMSARSIGTLCHLRVDSLSNHIPYAEILAVCYLAVSCGWTIHSTAKLRSEQEVTS